MVSIIKVDPYSPEEDTIIAAAEILKRGGLVAFPTETVYGLGADAFNPEAVEKIFIAKGRPVDNPMIVHIADMAQLYIVAEGITEEAMMLAGRFWPGPLTLIFKRSPRVPGAVTGGQNTVAVRMPKNDTALALIRASGSPIAAPSANLSGRPSGTTGEHVLDDFGDKIDLILDAGPVEVGLESTVLDLSTRPPAILRPGAVTAEDLEDILGHVVHGKETDLLKRSPGTRYRHYSPKTSIIIIEKNNLEGIPGLIEKNMKAGEKTGLVTCYPESYETTDMLVVKPMPLDLKEYASRMFAVIRELDNAGIDKIIVEAVEERGIGVAIMDRLRRAASKK